MTKNNMMIWIILMVIGIVMFIVGFWIQYNLPPYVEDTGEMSGLPDLDRASQVCGYIVLMVGGLVFACIGLVLFVRGYYNRESKVEPPRPYG